MATEPIVDRAARDQTADLLEQYLREEIDAFDLDEGLQKIDDETEDKTLDHVILQLWFFYDDFLDHKVTADKEQWDFLQRLLLLLRSDGTLEERTTRRWTIRQVFALLGAAGFGAYLVTLGVDHTLWFAYIPLGILSMVLARWRSREYRKRWRSTAPLDPFSSLAEILTFRRKLPDFRKRRYPRHLQGRQIWGPVFVALMWLPWIGMWLAFSPLVLLFQSLPEKEEHTSVATCACSGEDG
jgi:hypothetical protein